MERVKRNKFKKNKLISSTFSHSSNPLDVHNTGSLNIQSNSDKIINNKIEIEI